MIRTIKGHLHHISVHFVIANYSVGLIFAVLYLCTGNPDFDIVSYYTLAVALISTPIGFVTGVRVWRVKYKGHWGKLFRNKLIGGLILAILGLPAFNMRFLNTDILASRDDMTAYYLILLTLATACVSVLSYYGGRLSIR